MHRIVEVSLVVSLVVGAADRSHAQLVVNGDGTVTDTKSGLVWMRDAGSPMLDWTSAGTWASGLTVAGGGWRLPASVAASSGGLGEFGTLSARYGLLAYGPEPFTNVRSGSYWTSSSIDATHAVAFNWVDPALNPTLKSTAEGVWAVRNAPGGPTNVPIDVWIRDCPADDGTMPSISHCSDPLASPHIFFDDDDDLIMDAPRLGAQNTIKARVQNKSAAWAMQTSVAFYWWPCSAGNAFLSGSSGAKPFGGAQHVNIPANSAVWVSASDVLPASSGGVPWCFGAVVSHADNPAPAPATGTLADNNLAGVTMSRLVSTAGRRACPNYTKALGQFYLCGPFPYRRTFLLAAGIAFSLFIGWAFGRSQRRRGQA